MRPRLLIVLALAGLAAGGTAVVAEAAKQKPKRPAAVAKAPAGMRAGGGLLATAATYLGVTRAELRAELRSGKSLAQVATANGKSVDGLKQALLAPLRARIQAAQTAGRIDAARAQQFLQRAEQRIDRLVQRAGPAGPARVGKLGPRAGAKLHGAVLRTAANFIGVTPAALRAELRSGKSLAQVATANGKTVDGLKQALLAPLRTRIQAAQTAGRIDAARAQQLLQRAEQRIDRLVNRTPTRRR